MCFLSVYRLKYLVSVGIVVTLLIGIGLLYVLVYSFIISSITIQVQSDFRTLLISVFLSTSMLMILSSLAGIYGLMRKKNKFVLFYAITMLFYMISFLLLGIFTVNAPQFFQSQCKSPTQSEYQQTIQNGTSLLCKGDCECYYTNSQGYSQQTLTTMGIINYSLTNTTLPINAQNCPTWSNTTHPLTSQIEIIELFFNCSGWCFPQSTPPYYIFSNINGGTPESYCAESISSFMQKFGHIIQITSFAVFGFLCLILLIIVCLCLHPGRGLKYDSLELFKKVPVFIQQHQDESQITGR